MSIVFVGIDLAKNVFALHGVNALPAGFQNRAAPLWATQITRRSGRNTPAVSPDYCGGDTHAHHLTPPPTPAE